MIVYRAYILGPNGSIMRAEEFNATDDASAVVEARGLVNHQDVELWQLGRKVTLLKWQQAAE